MHNGSAHLWHKLTNIAPFKCPPQTACKHESAAQQSNLQIRNTDFISLRIVAIRFNGKSTASHNTLRRRHAERSVWRNCNRRAETNSRHSKTNIINRKASKSSYIEQIISCFKFTHKLYTYIVRLHTYTHTHAREHLKVTCRSCLDALTSTCCYISKYAFMYASGSIVFVGDLQSRPRRNVRGEGFFARYARTQRDLLLFATGMPGRQKS